MPVLVTEFRKELQEVMITLEKIARRIDENIAADEKAALDAELHNAAVAQARKELAAGQPVSNVPHDNPIDFNATNVATPSERAAIEAKQRQAALDRQAAAKAAAEK